MLAAILEPLLKAYARRSLAVEHEVQQRLAAALAVAVLAGDGHVHVVPALAADRLRLDVLRRHVWRPVAAVDAGVVGASHLPPGEGHPRDPAPEPIHVQRRD